MKPYIGNLIEVLNRLREDGPVGIDPQGLCPHYSRCRTAQALNMDFCSRYKCATFYYLREDKAQREIAEPDLSKIIQQHMQGNSNGNGRSNGRKVSSIAASFS